MEMGATHGKTERVNGKDIHVVVICLSVSIFAHGVFVLNHNDLNMICWKFIQLDIKRRKCLTLEWGCTRSSLKLCRSTQDGSK